MKHIESGKCPCIPEIKNQVGGGRVLVHRRGDEIEGRETVVERHLDRYCRICGQWHMFDHEHIERFREIGVAFRAQLVLGEPPTNEDPRSLSRTVAFVAGRA
jgi:hypothetical protein